MQVSGATAASVSTLWNARSVAVVGASDKPGSLGGQVVDYLRRYGFAGRIVAVHPTAVPFGGVEVVPRLSDVAGSIELAVLLVSAQRCFEALDDCIAAGVKAVVIGASGFAEIGSLGVEAQLALARHAASSGVRLLGPNCIGAVNLHSGLIASFSPLFNAPSTMAAGSLGIVSHSGGVGFGIASLAAAAGVPPGWVVTTGNEADVTAAEAIEALATEPRCNGVIGYLESCPSQAQLERLANCAVSICVMLSATSPAGAQMSVTREHSDVDEAELLRRNNIAVCNDVDDLIDMAIGFGKSYSVANRIAVVTTSGGAGILAADAIFDHGMSLAEFDAATVAALREILPPYANVSNPLDVTATVSSDPQLLTAALSIVSQRCDCDAILVCLCVLTGDNAEQVTDAIISADSDSKPVLVSRTGASELASGMRNRLSAAGIAEYRTPRRAINALVSAANSNNERT